MGSGSAFTACADGLRRRSERARASSREAWSGLHASIMQKTRFYPATVVAEELAHNPTGRQDWETAKRPAKASERRWEY